ncbi:hypothetical protein [Salisediminibacterium halotolerans]|uniref:hypothetical protein n=1 Tax=Salisediminibacterium halotolerans TaxID=517425 RepID=UPI000F112E01|nr:hypothetical protein [Salisediminibacterium halotolerans]RLJ72330.1 hypothetical protein BCL39_2230 [Actinophytocola xinjiangensis]RPE85544.1 hypothetical protein EDD67_2365 [Salisediminibacterium halotolerans]TWG33499.1 hypothetical protein BCL52_2225 [Salisediminibacterium halotolerans]GEL08946.1 hypothetical protein SHA02_23620 [Salisediminibacterium halotolerans]
MILAAVFLTACAENTAVNNEPDETERRVVAETESEDYLLRAVSEQALYEEDDEVKVRVKLMYTGSDESKEIRGDDSPFQISWSNIDQNISWTPRVQDSASSIVLEANEWYEEVYTAAEAADGTDESESFFADLQTEQRFPAGEYELEVDAEFLPVNSENGELAEEWISASLVFEVER